MKEKTTIFGNLSSIKSQYENDIKEGSKFNEAYKNMLKTGNPEIKGYLKDNKDK